MMKASRPKTAGSTVPDVPDLGQTPLLTTEEEKRLTRDYARTRDPALRRRIADANLRLVMKVAWPYARRSPINLSDLVQEGTLGLMEAIDRFDPARGLRLSTYAAFWIRAYILKYLLDNARVVRAGRSRDDRRAFFKGGTPAELSLDAPLRRDQAGRATLVQDLADESHSPPDEVLESQELVHLVRRRAAAFRRRLPSREAAVFGERLLRARPTPVGRLASRFAVSRQRICQIEKSLVASFRDFAAIS